MQLAIDAIYAIFAPKTLVAWKLWQIICLHKSINIIFFSKEPFTQNNCSATYSVSGGFPLIKVITSCHASVLSRILHTMKRFLKKQNWFFDTDCQLVLCLSFFLLLVLLKASHGNYDCEEDGIIYRGARFHDAPPDQRQQKWGLMKLKTDTWQEYRKACARVKECKGFMWYKKKTFYEKVCQFFSTWKSKDTSSSMVSGLVECE